MVVIEGVADLISSAFSSLVDYKLHFNLFLNKFFNTLNTLILIINVNYIIDDVIFQNTFKWIII